MKIGQLAQSADCDVQTIRYYEHIGIMMPAERSPAGHRLYGQAHVNRLLFIRYCRSMDIPLKDIRQLVNFAGRQHNVCRDVDEILDRQIASIEARIAGMQSMQSSLRELRNRCDGTAMPACAILTAFHEYAGHCQYTGENAAGINQADTPS